MSTPSTSVDTEILPDGLLRFKLYPEPEGNGDLGFKLTGNRSMGVYVTGLIGGTVIEQTRQLKAGDRLVQCHDVSLIGMSSDQIAKVLRLSFSLHGFAELTIAQRSSQQGGGRVRLPRQSIAKLNVTSHHLTELAKGRLKTSEHNRSEDADSIDESDKNSKGSNGSAHSPSSPSSQTEYTIISADDQQYQYASPPGTIPDDDDYVCRKKSAVLPRTNSIDGNYPNMPKQRKNRLDGLSTKSDESTNASIVFGGELSSSKRVNISDEGDLSWTRNNQTPFQFNRQTLPHSNRSSPLSEKNKVRRKVSNGRHKTKRNTGPKHNCAGLEMDDMNRGSVRKGRSVSAETGNSSNSGNRTTTGSQELQWHCPICLEGAKRIAKLGRRLMSTQCGHVFCSACLRDITEVRKECPNCRAPVKSIGQCHPIFM